jgi:type I restriction enzyme S subunit
MSKERWPVPPGWKWRKAGEIAQVVGGGTPRASDESNFDDDGTPWITPADLTGYNETYISRGRRSLSAKGLASCGAQVMPAGAVLFSSRAPIGYCVIARNTICTNQGFKSLVLHDGYVPEFIRYYLLSAKDYAESLASGTTFKELSGSRMADLEIPVTSTTAQNRIVAKLDGLFARSKATCREIDRLLRLMERYRQAIITAAFDGKLTTEWRRIHKIPPDSWTTATLRDVSIDIRYGTSTKCTYEPSRTPVLRIPNVIDGVIDISDLKYAVFSENEIKNLSLAAGDLLVT